jgi:transposase
VKTTQSSGPRGFDAGKRIKGRKRHIVTDTFGLMLWRRGASRRRAGPRRGPNGAAFDPQEPALAALRLRPLSANVPFTCRAMDGGYVGPKLRRALKGEGDWRIEIIKRSDAAGGFEVMPRRWVVERTDPWLGRCRRLAKDWEASIASAKAWLLIAHIHIIIRRLARFNAGPVEV